jgi:hypothetical protein
MRPMLVSVTTPFRPSPRIGMMQEPDDSECPERVLVVSKRVGRSRIATFHAPKPFTIIGECERADL